MAKKKKAKTPAGRGRWLTLRQLEYNRACLIARLLFKSTFGDRVWVTPAKACRFRTRFDIFWAAGHLLKKQSSKDVWSDYLFRTEVYENGAYAREWARLYINEGRK